MTPPPDAPPGAAPALPDVMSPGFDAKLRRLVVFGITVALGMLAVSAGLLLDARRDAWVQAERAAANLAKTLQRDIERNLAVYDLSLLGARDALEQPGIGSVSPGLRQAAMFDRSSSAEYLGSLLVLNRTGDIMFDSTSVEPHTLNFADRDYFAVHRDGPDRGLFLSQPFQSRLRRDDASIAISRRISGPSGEFAGVVVGTLRLAYFHDMFKGLDLGRDGVVFLVRDDGRMVARQPPLATAMGRDFSRAPVTGAIVAGGTGHVEGTSALDGVRRLFEFRRIANLPLHIAVGVSVDDVLAPWRRKAALIGGILVALAAAGTAMCLLFRRELSRRVQAEARLVRVARQLELAARTDGLTGLANRRAFQEALDAAWRGASRSGTPLSMLMIDADGFKLFNDHYGHQEGDRALQAVGEAIRCNLRRVGDLGARYGGEEFAVLLPDTELGGAAAMAERIRAHVRAAVIPHAESQDGFVTVSIGVAAMCPQSGERERVLVQSADAALYNAKRAGKNRVCVHDDAGATPFCLVPAAWGTQADSHLAG